MKIKTAKEVRELIENMYLNTRDVLQSIEKIVHMQKGVIDLDTHDVLLTSNKLLNIQLEAISKKLEVRDLVQL